jgi:hypothetical protein
MKGSPSVFGRHLLSMKILKQEIDAYSLLKNDKVLNWVKNLEVHQVGYLLEIQDGLKRSRSIPILSHILLYSSETQNRLLSQKSNTRRWWCSSSIRGSLLSGFLCVVVKKKGGRTDWRQRECNSIKVINHVMFAIHWVSLLLLLGVGCCCCELVFHKIGFFRQISCGCVSGVLCFG